MIKQVINLVKYDWKVTIFYFPTNEQLDEIEEILSRLNCNIESINKAKYILTFADTGFCCTNDKLKESVLVISQFSSTGELLHTATHEVYHLVSSICRYYNIDYNGELPAYLIGDIMNEVCDVICPIIADKEKERVYYNNV